MRQWKAIPRLLKPDVEGLKRQPDLDKLHIVSSILLNGLADGLQLHLLHALEHMWKVELKQRLLLWDDEGLGVDFSLGQERAYLDRGFSFVPVHGCRYFLQVNWAHQAVAIDDFADRLRLVGRAPGEPEERHTSGPEALVDYGPKKEIMATSVSSPLAAPRWFMPFIEEAYLLV
ncbi:TPA: hypothetical protein NJR17_002705 [Pseudomonas aeruginosa]|nr:hypothetical protein [Pseudomonas aeruginosa]HCG2322535.1 hypothetical protein [Pseudomonas aeruginosa]